MHAGKLIVLYELQSHCSLIGRYIFENVPGRNTTINFKKLIRHDIFGPQLKIIN